MMEQAQKNLSSHSVSRLGNRLQRCYDTAVRYHTRSTLYTALYIVMAFTTMASRHQAATFWPDSFTFYGTFTGDCCVYHMILFVFSCVQGCQGIRLSSRTARISRLQERRTQSVCLFFFFFTFLNPSTALRGTYHDGCIIYDYCCIRYLVDYYTASRTCQS